MATLVCRLFDNLAEARPTSHVCTASVCSNSRLSNNNPKSTSRLLKKCFGTSTENATIIIKMDKSMRRPGNTNMHATYTSSNDDKVYSFILPIFSRGLPYCLQVKI